MVTLVTWRTVSRVPAQLSSHGSVRRPDSPCPAPHPSSSLALYSPVCITLMTSSATLVPVPPAHSHWTGSVPAASPPPDCTEATPTCGNTCGKVLACANHNCSELYHRGNCPPCLQMARKECRCGAKVKVPCGREKHTKPPRCKKPCGVASNCHHPMRDRHNCHHPPCPTCKHVCDQDLSCGPHLPHQLPR